MTRRGMGLALGLMGTVLGMAAARAQAGGSATVDLETLGMPKETFHADALMRCPNDLLTYRAVEWLDAGTVLVAFTATPLCPTTMDPAVNAVLKLATFDTAGKLLHAVNVPYVAGLNNMLPHDGVWALADGRVAVELPPTKWVQGPAAVGELAVWSAELKPVQVMTLNGGTEDELHPAGVTADGRGMLMWRGMNRLSDAHCVVFGGSPIKETGACTAAMLDAMEAAAHDAGGFAVPKGEAVMTFTGASRDGSRASVFVIREETPECRMQGQYCPTSGTFVVFETKSPATKSGQALLKEKVSVLGRMALAPDGKHAAMMDKGRLEIVAVP
ncbi:MAG TPA: hypothetical protein VND90_02380 [Terracidiphilus sp.]|nr:hypothetical protein [Terracidiphilus sp.]